MFQTLSSPIPSISISFAPHEFPIDTPENPFPVVQCGEPDSPRPQFLLPPSPLSPQQSSSRKEKHGSLSPLGRSGPDVGGQGVERLRFEAMLKASRERSAMIGGKKPLELRKEIAMKSQKAKHMERRALFLSKLIAPPSPTAADMPVTPPDSPAIFHFSLPSPGLVSPLELFEDVANNPELYNFKATVEQVDFRGSRQKEAANACYTHGIDASIVPSSPLPSLDQISRRLMGSSATKASTISPTEQGSVNSRLPSFLRTRLSTSSLNVPNAAKAPAVITPIPDDTPKHSRAKSTYSPVRDPERTVEERLPFPKTLNQPKVYTRTKSSLTALTEVNVTILGASYQLPSKANERSQARDRRVQASRDLFSKLSKRTPGLSSGVRAKDDAMAVLSASFTAEDKQKRRLTAPAEMTSAPRGAHHPVLSKPGGF